MKELLIIALHFSMHIYYYKLKKKQPMFAMRKEYVKYNITPTEFTELR